ncbi:MAG: hydroxypyruvate isomerase [Bacteroidetes bacterium]|nr:MAG: hydroxypyruvate isomerase [Bacteroidota bacterium]
MSTSLSRRAALQKLAGGALLASTAGLPTARRAVAAPRPGRINHSVCKWCYPDLSVAELAEAAAEMGIASIELLGPEDWPTLERYGLICAMANGPSRIPDGFNRTENHEWLIPQFRERIREVAEAGYPNVICFSGNRAGLDDETGLENCVTGLKAIVPDAERHGVTICMELLNSKVNHPDYMCDRTAWGVELVKRVGSERFKLLYDIYHMQIMEGDIIRTIRDNKDYIGHYHTGGNPGRHEIDETQELYYPAIMRAIVETGFTGYVAQEFVPSREPLASLREAIEICTV